MRVTTAFKRLLRLPSASVTDVSFGAEGVIVTVRSAAPTQSVLTVWTDGSAAGDS